MLNGTPVPGEPEHPRPTGEGVSQTNLSPGVGSLLRGERKASKEEPVALQPSVVARFWQDWTIMRWLLLAGDVSLLTLASLLVLKNPGSPSLLEAVLCLTALAIGAALALLAVLGNRGR